MILVDFPLAALRSGTSTIDGHLGRRIIPIKPLLFGLQRLHIDSYILSVASWEEFLAVRELPELGLIVDALAYRSGDRATQRAIADASRARHPAQITDSVSAVARLAEQLARAFIY